MHTYIYTDRVGCLFPQFMWVDNIYILLLYIRSIAWSNWHSVVKYPLLSTWCVLTWRWYPRSSANPLHTILHWEKCFISMNAFYHPKRGIDFSILSIQLTRKENTVLKIYMVGGTLYNEKISQAKFFYSQIRFNISHHVVKGAIYRSSYRVGGFVHILPMWYIHWLAFVKFLI